MRPKGWLSESDEKSAIKMEEFVTSIWQSRPDPAEITPHDPAHFGRVEGLITKLISLNKFDCLSFEERKILTWCAWTHDIAMARAAATPGASSKQIRREHVEKGATWTANNWKGLCIDQIEAQTIADINKYHSRQFDIRDCSMERWCPGGIVRPRLLASYLRLADALDVASARIDERKAFELLVRQISRDADTTLFHWIKSLVVAGIDVNHNTQQIEIHFLKPHGVPRRNFDYIKRYVINEIEDELASVESVLCFGGINTFHVVSSREEEGMYGEFNTQLKDLHGAAL